MTVDRPSVDAARFVGVPVELLGGGGHLRPSLGERLSLLLDQRTGDLLLVLQDEFTDAPKRLTPRPDVKRSPIQPATLGARERPVDVIDGRCRDGVDDLLGGGIDHLDRGAVGGVGPAAIDVHLIRGHRFLS